MDIEALSQLRQRVLALYGGKRHLRLEGGEWFPRGRLLVYAPVTAASTAYWSRDFTYPGVRFSGARSGQNFMSEQLEPRWNQEQLSVIDAGAVERLIVDGGPGTGKTAVLTARIARLIDVDNVAPSNIWVVSFTRTAVAELRMRLSMYLKNKEDAFGIRVATIDSHAWSVNSGFNSDATISGTFDNNIKHVIELIKRHAGVFEYLQSVSHIFIDESQDVVGIRLELMLELLYATPDSAGITVFSDEAQAIYGFAEKKQVSHMQGTLPANVKKYFDTFRRIELSKIHRTEKLNLCDFFIGARQALKAEATPQGILTSVRKLARISSDAKAPPIELLPGFVSTLSGKTFILFRTRGEALHAASIFFSQNSPCRLRLSGLPNVIHPWLATVFWDWTLPELKREDFFIRWSQRIKSFPHLEADNCWRLLVHHFGKTSEKVDIEYMRRRLSSLSPPTEFCAPEYGTEGPVIGTVHTSKGRESENVIFYLPRAAAYRASQAEECMEEARTVFVGATRARGRLFIGDAEAGPGRTFSRSGRAFREVGLRLTSVNVEIGRSKDINAEDLTGLETFDRQDDAIKSQKAVSILGYSAGSTKVTARRANLENKFLVAVDHRSSMLFKLSTEFMYDLRGIVRELRLRTHGWDLDPLQLVGARTIVLNAQDARLQKLHRPWSDSGFMMAPLLIGFPEVSVGYR